MKPRLTPVASVQTRLAAAGLVWTLVGAGLVAAGATWLWGAGPAWAAGGLAAAAAAGAMKGRFVLAPRAERNAVRILQAGHGRCLFGAFSWPSWALVAGMMAVGAVLRRSSLPRFWLGLLYAAVGTALLVGARTTWKFLRAPRPA